MRNQDHLLEQIAALTERVALATGALEQSTAELARTRGSDVNGVLFSGVVTFSGTPGNNAGVGTATIDVDGAFGGLALWNNLGAGVVTVVAGGGADQTVPALPGPGGVQAGRIVVPGGAFWCGPFTGRAVTLYGLAAASVVLALYVNPVTPGA